MNSKIKEITLYSYNWQYSNGKYVYTITDSWITSTNVIDIILRPNTSDIADTISKAKISGYSQYYQEIQLFAWGEKPNWSIQATLICRGGNS